MELLAPPCPRHAELSVIHVIATIELVPGRRAEFLVEFQKNVPRVVAEAGCLEYGPAIDIPSGLARQIPIRGNVVTIVEKWESLAALQAHLVAPHMQTYRERVKDWVVGTLLQVLEPA